MKNTKFVFIFFSLLIWSFSLFSQENSENVSLLFFWGKGCPHCEKEKIFLDKLQAKHAFLEVKQYEIWGNNENQRILQKISKDLKINSRSVPITIIQNKQYIIGFNDEETTGKDIEKAILDIHQKILKKEKLSHGQGSLPTSITLPIFGEIQIKHFSLHLVTIVLGAIDGINPCAMWVLVMLLSFLIAINDRKKLILFGGIFILTSGLVYFMFMIAWLNLILFLGYIHMVKIIIGSVAILGGAFYIREFFVNKENVCKVTGSKQKKRISEKLSYVIEKKGFWISALAIIVLAFFVNLIEGVCSAGIPAVYTQVLAMSSLPPIAYYSYILLYIFVFLLGSIIVFLIAVLSSRLTNFTNSFSRYSHLIGGSVLVALGILLLFKPEWLMLG
ncbi:MAG: hypothetical protein WCP39_07270 [Chlamydiota bacterium]